MTADVNDTRRSLLTIGLANAGIAQTLYLSFLVVLPERVAIVADPAHRTSTLAVVASVGAFAALIAAVLVGGLSDRSLAVTGSRRRALQSTAILGGLALIAVPFAPSVGLLVLVWCVAQVGISGVLAVVTAGLADRFHQSQRGWASTYAAVGQVAGALFASAVAFGLPGHLRTIGALSGLLLLVTALPAAGLSIRATDPSALRPAPAPARRGYRDAVLAWAIRLVVTFANTLVVTFVNYYVADALDVSDPQRFVGIAAGLTAVLVLVGAMASGRRSDRTGRRRRYIAWAVTLMALGELVLGISPTVAGALAGCAIVGLGYGGYLAVDQALTTDVLPAIARYGRDTGIMNAATTIPQVAAPAVGAFLLSGAAGYGLLFTVGAATTLGGIVFVLPIRSVR